MSKFLVRSSRTLTSVRAVTANDQRRPRDPRTPASVRAVTADARKRPRDPRTPASVRAVTADARWRPRGRLSRRVRAYITRVRGVHYLLFLFCLLVGDLGFAYATPIPTCKREGVTSNSRGVPLRFSFAKTQGLYLPLKLSLIHISEPTR